MNSALLTRTPTLLSLAAIALSLTIIAVNVPPIARAVKLTHGDVIEEIEAKFAQFTADHQAEQAVHAERFKGRSLFFRPNLPPPPIREPVHRVEVPTPTPAPDPTPTPPPAPRTYSGPAIRAFDGDRVWFANGQLIRVGEEAAGIRVVAVNAPWSAEIAYAGWQGKVEIFPEFNPETFFRSAVDASRADLSRISSGGASASTSAPRPAATSGRTGGRPTATPARGRSSDNSSPPE